MQPSFEGRLPRPPQDEAQRYARFFTDSAFTPSPFANKYFSSVIGSLARSGAIIGAPISGEASSNHERGGIVHQADSAALATDHAVLEKYLGVTQSERTTRRKKQ